jgi:hypothetical protein
MELEIGTLLVWSDWERIKKQSSFDKIYFLFKEIWNAEKHHWYIQDFPLEMRND